MFDIVDVLGISQLLEWSKEKLGIKEKQSYIQQPLSVPKFMYRPKTFAEYISQEKAKDKVKLTISLISQGFPRHFLLMGNAGYGKTTLAGIIANEIGFNFNIYVGSNFDIDTFKDFLAKNEQSNLPNVLFIDEIAEVDKKTLTFMLPIIEDFKINGVDLRKFILIGATTDTYVISKRCAPFLDRIHCKVYLEDYIAEDLKKLLKQYNLQVHKAIINEETYDRLVKNVRYVPRIALAFFDYLVACKGDLDKVLQMNRIIKDGLDDVDIRILNFLNETNKPAGEEVISIIANMTKAEYKQLREPYLIRQGLISRTNRGRIILEKGKQFLQEIK